MPSAKLGAGAAGVTALLRQPGGFEGLARVGIHVHAGLLAIAERPDLGEGHFNGHSGRFRPAMLARMAWPTTQQSKVRRCSCV